MPRQTPEYEKVVAFRAPRLKAVKGSGCSERPAQDTRPPYPTRALGVDPGQQKTGICELEITRGGEERIVFMKTCPIEDAEKILREKITPGLPVGIELSESRHFNPRKGANYKVSLKIAQDVGHNRNLAAQLIGFCKCLGASVYVLQPRGTKMKSRLFKVAAGWSSRSSSHSRDAWGLATRALGLAKQDAMRQEWDR